ncbi:MAG: alcohol dehydrogenase catalytic domain-containing protein [Bryobacteraceae bacterium]|jgi:L-iditol 2-dehydrogenase
MTEQQKPMQVAELTAPRQFRVVSQGIRDPGPGEVQVRVQAVGICGSDLHAYSEGGVGEYPNVYPMVLGHEPAGTVAMVGPGVTGWSPGDRAALEPAVYCYHCQFCQTGHHNVCENIRFFSAAGEEPGFFREFVNLPAHNLLAIPPELAIEHATIVEPLAVAVHSLQAASPRLGETAAVFGAGPIGLLTIAVLKASGAGRIWAVEPVAHRREMAKLVGADAVLDPAALDPTKQILGDTGKRGVDCAIDCAAKEHTTQWALQAARSAGRVVITGIHSTAQVLFDMSTMRRKELTIYNVRRSNRESEAALELLANNVPLFAPLVTHGRPLDRISEAFEINEAYAGGVVKMIVRPSA